VKGDGGRFSRPKEREREGKRPREGMA